MDVFSKCENYSRARDAEAIGLYPYFIPLAESEGTVAEYDGRSLIMCGSNNYLGLTTHPEVQEAAREAISRYGSSCTGSRFLNGTLELHERLESELADWIQKDRALVFSTGMQVNLGTISSLVGRNEYVILDREDLKARINDLEEKNSRLAEEVGLLSNDQTTIESLARIELGLVKPGETVYILPDAAADGQ